MQLFLDTANVKEIREMAETGVLDGITTNPSLVAKEGRSFREVLLEIAGLVNGPISAEVVAVDVDGMLKEGRELAAVHKNIVVKVPLTPEGIKACRKLTDEGVRVNVTLCFSANQALLAAKAGAYFISPFIGRIDDAGGDGMQLIEEIRTIYDNYGFQTKLLAASIRHPLHVVQAATAGADVATMPYAVMQQMFKHPLTDVGLKKFLADWERAGVKR
jgi:transaldolase